MKVKFGSWFIDVICGCAAYVTARAVWGDNTGVFKNLPLELLTFGAVYLVLQGLIRGRKMIAKGR